jgi:peptide deformylase
MMSIKPLVQLARDEFWGIPTPLREPSSEIVDFGPELNHLLEDLQDTFWAHEIAVGLSAPQIGVNSRVAIINVARDRHKSSLVLVNPVIESVSGKKDIKKESCMSLPNYRGPVERRHKMFLAYQDETGKRHRMNVDGFLARVIAHEIDHLDGILYLDRMESEADLEFIDFESLGHR